MNKPTPEMDAIGLAFFGNVSASISHEIKNTLAIINENAGLLEDMTHMANQGIPLSFERLQRLSHVIKKQVNRADGIVKKMNRFAHTADPTIQSVDLYETAALVTEVCGRIITMHNATVEIKPPQDPVIIASVRFWLAHLIWACTEFMICDEPLGKTVILTLTKRTPGAQISLSGSHPLQTTASVFPSYTEKMVIEILSADIRVDAAKGEIRILLPEAIP